VPETVSRDKERVATESAIKGTTIGADLIIVGNIRSKGTVLVEGTVSGDIRAKQIVIAAGANVAGEIVGEDIVIEGRVAGRVRGTRVRLRSQASVEGDVIHSTIAIESGAHFDGGVLRSDDPISGALFSEMASFEVLVQIDSQNEADLDRLEGATKGLMSFLGYELEPGPVGGLPSYEEIEEQAVRKVRAA
jgi:cytoskeletal protein CcmA (bactofilin family)